MFIVYSKVCEKKIRSVSVILSEKNVPKGKKTQLSEKRKCIY